MGGGLIPIYLPSLSPFPFSIPIYSCACTLLAQRLPRGVVDEKKSANQGAITTRNLEGKKGKEKKRGKKEPKKAKEELCCTLSVYTQWWARYAESNVQLNPAVAAESSPEGISPIWSSPPVLIILLQEPIVREF